MIDEPPNDGGENVSAIQSLTHSAQILSHSLGRWNIWYQVLAGVTAVLAVVVFFIQWNAVQKGKLLATIQVQLLAEKDRQLATDLKDKDARIGEANIRAGETAVRAGNAIERAAKLEYESVELRQQNLATEAALGKEQSARFELEQYLAPRGIGDQVGISQELSKFKNISMIVVTVPEMESRRLAGMIQLTGEMTPTWKVVAGQTLAGGEMFDGVTVFGRAKTAADESEKAGQTLVELLRRNVDASFL